MKNNLRFLLLPLLVGSFNIGTAHALISSAHANTFLGMNYGEEVLNAVLENWKNPDPAVTGVTSVTVRIAKDGRPYSCEIRKKSSSEIVDNSICQVIADIGHFSPLDGIDNGEVYLSFVHDHKPYLDLKTVTTPVADEGEEEVDSVKNPIDNPIKELQKQADVKLDSEQLIDKDVILAENNNVKNNVEANDDQSNMAENTAVTAGSVATTTSSATKAVPSNTTKASTKNVANDKKNIQKEVTENNNAIPNKDIKTLEYTDVDPYARKVEEPKKQEKAIKKEQVEKNVQVDKKQTKEQQVQKDISSKKINKKAVEATNQEDKVYPPIATEKQPQTLVISREEALQPPSKNLVDPSTSLKDYSNYILQEATPHFRFPASVHGNYQIVARIDLLADGTLEKATINKSSGVVALDDEILRVLKTQIKYPPVPSKNKQSLWLTFNIKK